MIETGRKAYRLDNMPPPGKVMVAAIDLSTVKRVTGPVVELVEESGHSNGCGGDVEVDRQLPDPGQTRAMEGPVSRPEAEDRHSEQKSGLDEGFLPRPGRQD